MTSIEQKIELRNKIWKIANEVRGSVDGWDFKQFVLGALFYRFISENFTNYIEGGDESVDYTLLLDDVITPEIKDDAIKTKGYFIYPSQLFVNVAKTANTNPNLNTDLKAIFDAIESSANGYPSEPDIKGLFADFDTTSTRLGNTVESKNDRLAKVLKGVEELNFGKFEDKKIDLFGDAYEFLISNYAQNAGKSGGEFFTPTHVSKLIAQLAMHGQTTVNKIYDPAVGSGSLLLQAKDHFEKHIIEEGFYGQEVNHTTYNLARMNMFLHNINYDKFNIALGNTLTDPRYGDEKPFDAIVSNPPYSIKWKGDDDPTLINDDRFAPAGVLAPKSKADFAFVLHALSYLSSKGRAAIVCFPGIFYRGGAEQKIRKYLVENNFVETIISLAPNLFYGTPIAVTILVLSKHKTENKTQFIDANGEDFFKKVTNNNVLEDKHIEKIMGIFDSKKNVEFVAKTIDNSIIAENDYNLSVSSYVAPKNQIEKVDIDKLNEEILKTVQRVESLRAGIDTVINELELSKEQFSRYHNQFLNIKRNAVEWKSLSEIGEFQRGKRFVKTDMISEGIPCIHYGEMYTHYGIWANKSKSFLSQELVEKRNLRVAEKGDVIIVAAGETIEDIGMGTAWLGDEGVVIHDACFSFRSHLNPKYVAYFTRTKQFHDQIRSHISSGKISAINARGVGKAIIPVLPREEQERIVSFLDKFDALTSSLSEGLPKEIKLRQKQYEYYRDMLIAFPKNNNES
ncbi:type I restriction-modification system subunit M [Aquiflexum sp. TKW24L]|uniref:type I restriction-modification system subunit M n=1 Tax=Aquiflexum sp. TKW24L TaxID=2942212 RepID=UPI0020BDD5AC|nr:type I restriction-modification system subunit M [Aquiflexum sp. TKW24L]MCL6258497.1 type I restriction-modification system subunit M [Aquiflexum sp. TKW24L]